MCNEQLGTMPCCYEVIGPDGLDIRLVVAVGRDDYVVVFHRPDAVDHHDRHLSGAAGAVS